MDKHMENWNPYRLLAGLLQGIATMEKLSFLERLNRVTMCPSSSAFRYVHKRIEKTIRSHKNLDMDVHNSKKVKRTQMSII